MSGVQSDERQGDNCLCVAEEKGHGQSRAPPRPTMVNLSLRALHRLCLASLFGRRVVNGVGYVVSVGVPVSACSDSFCLFVFTFASAMLSCLQDKPNVFFL